MSPALPRLVAALLLLGLVACGRDDAGPTVAGPLGPAEPSLAECSACGMVVREQPAPRGQVVHRDGTRRFFCSLDDLRRSLAEPSRHGEVVEVYVEAMDPAADPREVPVAARPWVDATKAMFVVDIDRPHVMGQPVLAYSRAPDARQVAERHRGRVLSWDQLRAAP